jgi:hypothetical protein
MQGFPELHLLCLDDFAIDAGPKRSRPITIKEVEEKVFAKWERTNSTTEANEQLKEVKEEVYEDNNGGKWTLKVTIKNGRKDMYLIYHDTNENETYPPIRSKTAAGVFFQQMKGEREEGEDEGEDEGESGLTPPDAKKYLNAEKVGIRAAFAAAARGETLVYLDDAAHGFDESATKYFQSIGYTPEHLVAVNKENGECEKIDEGAEAEMCQSDILTNVLKNLTPMSVGGVWADYTSYEFPEEDVELALRAAKYVFALTLTSQRNQRNLKKVYSKLCGKSEQIARQTMYDVLNLADHQWQCTSLQVYGSANESRGLSMVNLQFQRRCFLNRPVFVQGVSIPPQPSPQDCDTMQSSASQAPSQFVEGMEVVFKRDKNQPRHGTLRHHMSKRMWWVHWKGDENWPALLEELSEKELRNTTAYYLSYPKDERASARNTRSSGKQHDDSKSESNQRTLRQRTT